VAFNKPKILIRLTANEKAMLMPETVNKSKAFCPFEVCASLRCDWAAGPFPTIFKLVDAMFVMLVQTAAVERGFSMHHNLNRMRKF